jgi:hypothetical protein
MRNILTLLLLTVCCHVSAGCKDKYGAAMNRLVAEQRALDRIDTKLKEFDKVIAEREQEMKTEEHLSGHGKNLTPEQVKLADDQLAVLKSQEEQLRKSYKAERLELYNQQVAQEAVVMKAEREVKEAHW